MRSPASRKARPVRSRAKLLTVCVLTCVAVGGVAASAAGGVETCLRSAGGCLPRFDFSVDGSVSPSSLPRVRKAPVRLGVAGRIEQGPALALREAVFAGDGDVGLNVKGLPACDNRGPRLLVRHPNELRWHEKRCRASIVGRGRVWISISFPEMDPIPVSTRVVLLYGGTSRGAILLYVLAKIDMPVPVVLAASVHVRRKPGGRWSARAEIPRIAGGSGAITRFSLRVGKRFTYRGGRKSLFSARCPDGELSFEAAKLLFKNEARIPSVAAQTVLKSRISVPCRPRG